MRLNNEHYTIAKVKSSTNIYTVQLVSYMYWLYNWLWSCWKQIINVHTIIRHHYCILMQQ